MTYDELLAGSQLPRLEARALMEHVSGKRREWLIAHGDQAPDIQTALEFGDLCERRRLGSPIAYLVGWREFHGRRFKTSPDVLIPRPETELLVDRALELAGSKARIIDLGTGSGCIALTMACEREDIDLLATDQSTGALQIANENARLLCPQALADQRLRFHRSDWWLQISQPCRFDLVVSNPPYIEPIDPHLEQGDLRFEPRTALTDGQDGLEAFRQIARGASAFLAPGGTLLLEHGYQQAPALAQLLRQAGFGLIATHRDAAGWERVTEAKLTGLVHTS